jgi:hypothetical protein
MGRKHKQDRTYRNSGRVPQRARPLWAERIRFFELLAAGMTVAIGTYLVLSQGRL